MKLPTAKEFNTAFNKLAPVLGNPILVNERVWTVEHADRTWIDAERVRKVCEQQNWLAVVIKPNCQEKPYKTKPYIVLKTRLKPEEWRLLDL